MWSLNYNGYTLEDLFTSREAIPGKCRTLLLLYATVAGGNTFSASKKLEIGDLLISSVIHRYEMMEMHIIMSHFPIVFL